MRRVFRWAEGAGAGAGGSSHGHSDDLVIQKKRGWLGPGKGWASQWEDLTVGTGARGFPGASHGSWNEVQIQTGPIQGHQGQWSLGRHPLPSLWNKPGTQAVKGPKGHIKTARFILNLFSQKRFHSQPPLPFLTARPL